MNVHGIYAKLSPLFRERRMHRFTETFQINAGSRILDVGGSQWIWKSLPVTPQVVLINLFDHKDHGEGFPLVLGDARELPFKDNSFDVVFSNSLIEHLYSFEQQQKFAAECRRVASRYYVQVPNQRFFLEPHLLTPFIHWLPKPAQARLLRNVTVWGLVTRPTKADCQQFTDEVRLLTKRELRRLFPEAEIWHERVFGISKSLMAVKNTF